MQVILLERIEKLGQMGDIVNVKPGFARNYLLPQRKARRATKDNVALFEQQRAHLEAENLSRRGEAEKVGRKLDGVKVVLIRQAGESGQLYGSANARDIAEAVSAAGFTISRGQVELSSPIKTLGLHAVKVRLHPEVAVTVTANVARSDAEAETQVQSGRMVSAEEQRAAEDAAEAEAEAALDRIEAEEAAAREAAEAEEAVGEDAEKQA